MMKVDERRNRKEEDNIFENNMNAFYQEKIPSAVRITCLKVKYGINRFLSMNRMLFISLGGFLQCNKNSSKKASDLPKPLNLKWQFFSYKRGRHLGKSMHL